MTRRRNLPLIRCLKLRRRFVGLFYMPDLATLARGYGVSVRTIRRDIHALHAAGEHVPRWRKDRRDDEWGAVSRC